MRSRLRVSQVFVFRFARSRSEAVGSVVGIGFFSPSFFFALLDSSLLRAESRHSFHVGRPNCSCSCRLGGLAQEEEEKRREEVEKRRGAGSVCSLAGSPSGEPKRKKRNRLFSRGQASLSFALFKPLVPLGFYLVGTNLSVRCPLNHEKEQNGAREGELGTGKRKRVLPPLLASFCFLVRRRRRFILQNYFSSLSVLSLSPRKKLTMCASRAPKKHTRMTSTMVRKDCWRREEERGN